MEEYRNHGNKEVNILYNRKVSMENDTNQELANTAWETLKATIDTVAATQLLMDVAMQRKAEMAIVKAIGEIYDAAREAMSLAWNTTKMADIAVEAKGKLWRRREK